MSVSKYNTLENLKSTLKPRVNIHSMLQRGLEWTRKIEILESGYTLILN